MTSQTTQTTKSQQSHISVKTGVVSIFAGFLPFLRWLPLVNSQTMKSDFIAAITSAIFALPQCIAFAIIAGLPPEFGLYAAIVVPIICAFFGSSWHTVSGPTVTTSVVIFQIVSIYAAPGSPLFISYVLLLTLMAGVLQLIFGIIRAGHLVNFISSTVITGFSAGAAVLIITSQLANFLGLPIAKQSNIFLELWAIVTNISQTSMIIFTLSSITLACSIICKIKFKKVPYLLVAMIIGSTLSIIFKRYFDAQEINMIGALPRGLPSFTAIDIDNYHIRQLFSSSIAVALLGIIQTISISKSIAARTGQSINANQEFVGQGLANIVASFYSGFFSSSSFTRTAINFNSGAKTPIANILSSGIIALLLVYAAKVTSYLPTAAMSAIIILVGWQLIDFSYIKKIIKTSRSELAIFLVTLISTLVLSLEFAIYCGVFLALLLHLQKTSQPKVLSVATDKHDAYLRLRDISSTFNKECPQLKIIRIDGSLFFGSIDHVRNLLNQINTLKQNNILIICDGMTLIDISGAEMLLKFKKHLQSRDGDLYLSGLKAEAHSFLVNTPYWQDLEANKNIFNYSVEAIGYIFNNLDHKKCRYCDKRIFIECDQITQIKMNFNRLPKQTLNL